MPVIALLYIDDEPDLLTLGKLFLEMAGDCSVDTTLSAPEALATLRGKAYDAIISDYQMPEMNGIEFLKRVRREYGKIPFILFTGRGREEVVIQAINEGADFYLQKGGDVRSQFAELKHKVLVAVARRTAEEDLRITSDRLHMAQEIGHVGTWEADLRTGMLWASSEAFRLFGLDRPDGWIPLDQAMEQIENSSEVRRKMREDIRKDRLFSITYTIRTADRSATRYIHTVARLLLSAEGAPERLVGVIHDITGQKLAEETLRESWEQYRVLLDESADPVFSIQADGKYRYVNHAFAAVAGRPVDQILGRTTREIFPPEKAAIGDSVLQDVLRTGSAMEVEMSMTVSGETRHFLVTVTPLRDGTGAIASFICSAKDITERRNAEEALRESEERFRAIVEQSTDTFYRQNLQTGAFEYISAKVQDLLGFTPAEILSLSFEEQEASIHPDDRPGLRSFAADLVEADTRGTRSIRREFRIRNREGAYRWIQGNYTLQRDEEGSPWLVIGALHDITDRKMVEQAVRESEDRFRNVLNAANEVVFQSDPESRLTFVSDRVRDVLGYDPEELLGRTPFELIPSAVEQARVAAMYQEYLRDGRPVPRMTHTCLTRDGRERILSVAVVPVHDAGGRMRGFQGVVEDVTEQKMSEQDLIRKNEELLASYEQLAAAETQLRANLARLEAQDRVLRRSEEQYRQFFRITRESLFITTPDDRWIDCNDALAEMFGYRGREEVFAVPVSSFYADPEDRRAFIPAIEAAGYIREHPLQLKRRDGTVFTGLITIAAWRDPDTTLNGYVGTIREAR